MTGQIETVRHFEDETGNCLTASLSEDGKEILLWATEGGQSDMQATVWLDSDKAKELAHYLLYLAEFANKKCCMCGEVAINKHMSIVGRIPFYLCDQHHKETYPAMGWDDTMKMNRTGLMQAGTNEWIY
jgi:hypothetical protein